jgi:hypothetical protein
VIAHVGGVPLEETLLPLVSGAGAVLLMARAWVAWRMRRGSELSGDTEESEPINKRGRTSEQPRGWL